MANIKKFLDQSGVSILWGRIQEELDKKALQSEFESLQEKVKNIEESAYDDSEIRKDIDGLEGAIEKLNGEKTEEGSVQYIAAAAVAEIVADAHEDYDTLKEIADWIRNDTTGAASMANDINAVKGKLDGIDGKVTEYVTGALSNYATSGALDEVDGRVVTLENAGYQTAADVEALINTNAIGLTETEINEAIAAAQPTPEA